MDEPERDDLQDEFEPAPPPPEPEGPPDEDPDDLVGLDPKQSLQAALLAASEPISPGKLAHLVGVRGPTVVRQLVREINDAYAEMGRAFYIREVAGGLVMMTRPAFARWLRQLHVARNEMRLSEAAMETLSVVAYRQPVLRAEVEEIRGAQSGEMLRQLMDKGLVRIAGRDDSLGRPILYGTTRAFLEHFGLRHLDDLPMAAVLREPFAGRPAEEREEHEEEIEEPAEETEEEDVDDDEDDGEDEDEEDDYDDEDEEEDLDDDEDDMDEEDEE